MAAPPPALIQMSDDVDDDMEQLLGSDATSRANASGDADDDDDDDDCAPAPPPKARDGSSGSGLFGELFDGIDEAPGPRLARIAAPRALCARGEVSGALGDLGTFLPDVVALASVTGGPPPAPFVFWSGVWSVWTGLLFDLPMPVQARAVAVACPRPSGVDVSDPRRPQMNAG